MPRRISGRSAAVAVVLGLLGLVTPSAASATEVQACISASEKGQKAQKAGKLREAREHFLVCGGDSCPAIIRHDCIHWNSEIANALPTVVFGAHDKQGRDLFDVTVSMDGEVLVKKLDGKAVTIDPGKHVFRFESSGLPSLSETTLVKEGERARVLNVTFEGPAEKPPDTKPPDTKPPVTGDGDKTDPTNKDDGHTIYPWIVVGIGAVAMAVGAAIALTAPARPANCSRTTQTCQKQPKDETDADLAADRQKAGTADSQPVLGLAVGGVGLALAVGGLVWHFLEPTIEAKPATTTSLRFRPWATANASGLVLDARF